MPGGVILATCTPEEATKGLTDLLETVGSSLRQVFMMRLFTIQFLAVDGIESSLGNISYRASQELSSAAISKRNIHHEGSTNRKDS